MKMFFGFVSKFKKSLIMWYFSFLKIFIMIENCECELSDNFV